MQTKTIRELTIGEFFRLCDSDSDTAPVWVRGEYVRPERKYSTHRYDDINDEQLRRGARKVYVGFTF